MELKFNKLFKIDVENNAATSEQFQENDNLNVYVKELLEKVTEEVGDRSYKFEEGSETVKNALKKLIKEEDIEDTCFQLARRLLQKEISAQDKYGHLHDIQKGMLIISYVEMTDTENKIIISKADYNTFIEELSGEIKSGLPLKKKIFKSFIANVSDGEISKMVTFDVNAKVAQYWWKEFLELDVVVQDEENTKLAFKAIENKILRPIEKKYKSDFLYLWNTTIAYFRGEGEFSLEHYRDEVIGNYQPFHSDLDMENLKLKCNDLPQSFGFDLRFNKVPGIVKNRFKKELKLSDEIKLLILHDVADPSKTFKAKEDVDGKYIMIRSDLGYEFAKKNEIN